jgi:hypothetical protein
MIVKIMIQFYKEQITLNFHLNYKNVTKVKKESKLD